MEVARSHGSRTEVVIAAQDAPVVADPSLLR